MTHHIYEMTNRFNKIFPLRRVSARLSVLLLVLAVGIQLSAQRRVTPVQPTAPGTPPKVEREKRLDRTHVVEQLDASGNTILVDTVTGQEVVDSLMLPAPPKMEYPLLHEIIGGVNLW
ncbi:MAG: hypothetical protein K2K65_00075, partial [Duncaniella sp.]|nr:hypothetical protein [Duncaniella sp.]